MTSLVTLRSAAGTNALEGEIKRHLEEAGLSPAHHEALRPCRHQGCQAVSSISAKVVISSLTVTTRSQEKLDEIYLLAYVQIRMAVSGLVVNLEANYPRVMKTIARFMRIISFTVLPLR